MLCPSILVVRTLREQRLASLRHSGLVSGNSAIGNHCVKGVTVARQAKLVAELNRILGDAKARLPAEAADIVDAQAIEPVELPAPAGAAPAAPGEAAGPSAEDLI